MLANRPKSTIKKLTKNSKIFKAIIEAIKEKKGENIISLDLRKIPEAVSDFFIICEASNPNQLKAIADFIEEDVKNKCGESAYKHEGRQVQQWILIDYVNKSNFFGDTYHTAIENQKKTSEFWIKNFYPSTTKEYKKAKDTLMTIMEKVIKDNQESMKSLFANISI
jgi:ribosome-associated protein